VNDILQNKALNYTHRFDMHIVAFRRPEKLEIWCLPFRNNSATTFVNVSSRHFTQWTRQLSLLHKRALNREHLPQLGVLRSGYMTQLFYDGQFVQGHFVRGGGIMSRNIMFVRAAHSQQFVMYIVHLTQRST